MIINKPDEIDKIIKEGQFKYLELVSRDKRYGGYNVNPGLLKDKINQIKKFLVTLPDDLYYINFKINQKGDVFQYTYNKGNVSLNEAPMNITLPVSNLEKFQTLEEWKRQERKISELEKELELLKLKEQFKGLSEGPKEAPKNQFLGFAENVLPIFVPFLDKYMTLKERQIAIQEQKQKKIIPQKKVVNKFRPIPDQADPNFQNYLNYFEGLSDNEADKELEYLQINKPDIFNQINSQFYEDDQEVQ